MFKVALPPLVGTDEPKDMPFSKVQGRVYLAYLRHWVKLTIFKNLQQKMRSVIRLLLLRLILISRFSLRSKISHICHHSMVLQKAADHIYQKFSDTLLSFFQRTIFS